MCKVSVIMPVYHAERYVSRAIESILNQSYQDFELILVEDGSTDNSLEEIKKFQDERIRLYCNEQNRGITYSRNRAIELARGEYLAWMDDDDLAPKDRLKDCIAFFEAHPEADVVAGNTYIMDENDCVTGMFARVWHNPDLIRASMLFQNQFGNGSAMVRKAFLDKYGIRYREDMQGVEDYMFWAECSVHGTIMAMDQILLYWRKHANETARKQGSDARSEAIQRIQRYLLDSYGYHLTRDEYACYFRMFDENKGPSSEEEIKELYALLKKILRQSRELGLEHYDEIRIACRKIFGKKCSLAFFLWEDR